MNTQVIAQSKSVKISPRKVRLVADAVRNMPLERALKVLTMTRKQAALPLAKTIKSALANAKHNNNMNEQLLHLTIIEITEGQAMKRFHPSTRGRIHPYKKRTSNIRVVLEQKQPKTKIAKKEVSEEEL